MEYKIPDLPLKADLETKAVLRQAIAANTKLAELKGVVKSVPNPSILIRTLSLQEAKDSSAIENIITTQDELYKTELTASIFLNPAAKEVSTYADALMRVVDKVKKNHIITSNYIIEIYQAIKNNTGGFTTTPGKVLKNEATGQIVYRPPQSIDEIQHYMDNLEQFINHDELSNIDPLIKMAVIHHQFESIHPFGDGNGRAGRVLNILYLVAKDLLDIPILYLSRFIIRNKDVYYKLIQQVRDTNNWEDWILFMLKGVEVTADETIRFVEGIRDMMQRYKHSIRDKHPKIYSQDLINNLFRHPYTKIEFLVDELGVSRPTANAYINILIDDGFIEKMRIGKQNFYINKELFDFISNAFHH